MALLALLVSPVMYADDAADNVKEAAADTPANDRNIGKEGEEEPDCD